MNRVFASALVFVVGCEQCWGVTPHDLHPVGSGSEEACMLDSDCATGFACEAELCTEVCVDSADCDDGAVCVEGVNTEEHVCRATNAVAGHDAGPDGGD